MKIVFVTYHTCARANKMAQALVAKNHQVIILQHLAASEEILYGQQLSAFYHGKDDLTGKVKELSQWADIFHVHNEPDWPVWVTKQNTNRPVVYDCHDLDSQRSGRANEDETKAFGNADAAVFPSKSYLNGAIKYHNKLQTPTFHFPSVVIPSMCTEQDYERLWSWPYLLPKIDALVYEGHHIAPVADADFKQGHAFYYEYRDYRDFILKCSMNDIPTALCGTRAEYNRAYRNAGAMTNPMLPYGDMLRELTRYSWGFCGHPDDHLQWQKSMPNKLFEYLAAGLPVIAWNCREVGEFVTKHDVGVVIRDYHELKSVFKDQDLRDRLADNIYRLNNQHVFTMDTHIFKLIDGIYRKVLNV